MQKLVSILIVIGFFAIVLKPVGPYLEYALNQEFIANNYCGNIARPELKCNGACYLMQRLKTQAEDTSGDQFLPFEAGAEIVLLASASEAWPGFAPESKRIHLGGSFATSIWTDVPPIPPPRPVFV